MHGGLWAISHLGYLGLMVQGLQFEALLAEADGDDSDLDDGYL